MPAHSRDCRRAVRRDAGMQGDNGSDHRAGNTHFDHFSVSGGSVFFKKPDRVLICDPKFVTRAASRQMIGLPSPRRQEARSRVSIRKNCRRRLIDAREPHSRTTANKLALLFLTQQSGVRRSPETAEAWSWMWQYRCESIELVQRRSQHTAALLPAK